MKNIATIAVALLIWNSAFAQTQRIKFMAPYMYPEGVAVNPATGLIYVSSVKTGTIGVVDNNGVYKELHRDAGLKSSFGMKVDPRTNRLWVCIADPNHSIYSTPATFQKMSRVISIDLATGKRDADIDLSGLITGKHFANDLAFDGKGNVYITDSFAAAIYKVDAAGKASVFARSDMFMGEDVGLNGIVYHPSGYFLVACDHSGVIFKVDAKDPSKISKVKVDMFFTGADGLLLDAQNNLILIQNRSINKASQLASSDNWVSAKVMAATMAADRFAHPTTGFIKDARVWLLNSKMNELSDSTMGFSKDFSFQLAELKKVP